MAKKLTDYERACRDLPKRSEAESEAEEKMRHKDNQGQLRELAWAVLHELDMREEGEDGWGHVNPKVWRAWLTKYGPADNEFPQDWRR